jgi:2'-5' RNA ligase
MSIRSFIALTLPTAMANVLGDASAKMAYQDKSNAVRWVDQENFHITLSFLGDQNEHTLELLAEQLDEHLPHAGIPLTISHFSPFPESRPKLIAAMIKSTEELRQIHHQVQSALLSAAVSLEKRRFIPHITLGRMRHSKNHFAGSVPMSIELSGVVDEVVLFESILTPQGAEYEALFRFPLEPFSLSNLDDENEV